ncbi:hypothetical protein ACN08N_23760 [Photobacterium leiognathi subsp. mandapamensis]
MAILDLQHEYLTANQVEELNDSQKTFLIVRLMKDNNAIQEVEVDRFRSRQAKCNKCIFQGDISCCDKDCYPADRLDNKSVYFKFDSSKPKQDETTPLSDL